jgi:D-lyxose ketol-isomerase
MLDADQVREIRRQVVEMVEDRAGFRLSETEKANIAVVGFGEEDFFDWGAAAIDTIIAPRYGGRLIVFFPNQRFPEHWHPDVDGVPGKEETFRVLWGQVTIYCPGEPSPNASSHIPAGKEAMFTSRHEVVLRPGEQATAALHDRHWLVAGPDGTVGLELSSTVRDEFDRVTDPGMKPIAY